MKYGKDWRKKQVFFALICLDAVPEAPERHGDGSDMEGDAGNRPLRPWPQWDTRAFWKILKDCFENHVLLAETTTVNRQSQVIIMKRQKVRIYAVAASAALFITAGGSAYPQQIGVPDTGDGSSDQLVQLGDTAFFSVNAVDGDSYQWLRNGAAIAGQTNSTLTFENTQISDAGYYSCNTANAVDIVPTISASLEVYTINPDFLVVVYAAPIFSGGSQGTCPGPYKGYVTYIKTVAQGWGWTPSTNTTIYTASDTTRTNTKVEYGGDYGDEGCAQTTITIPYPTFSPAYRFAIYFTNNVPTTNYPITLSGFNP